MRGLALTLLAALLVAGCAGTTPAEAPAEEQEGSRTSRGGPGEGQGGNRTAALLGSASGGMAEPGTYPLHLRVPLGGATKVVWSLEVVPVAAFTFDGVQGPGCQTTGWHSSITSSGTTGDCGTVQPGQHEWSFTLNAPVASYQVEVLGLVWDPAEAPSNATER